MVENTEIRKFRGSKMYYVYDSASKMLCKFKFKKCYVDNGPKKDRKSSLQISPI